MKLKELKTIIDLLDDDVDVYISRTPPEPEKRRIGFALPEEEETLKSLNEKKEN